MQLRPRHNRVIGRIGVGMERRHMSPEKTRGGILSGVRVLDLTRVLSGPFCTMLLADQGAEVVKVEEPGRGDDARHLGPPFRGDVSGFFVSVNRNKKSLTLNLKAERGVDLLKQLVRRADVFVENFRPGVAERLGIDYPALSAIRPKLVYASVSGFGQTGPYRERPGYNIIVQALSGVMSTSGPSGKPDGEPGGEPYPIGVSLGDIPAGMFAAFAITTALYARERTGRGQYIDVSMLDSLVAMMENPIVRHGMTGAPPEPFGRRHPSITPYGIFDAADGPIALAVGNDRLWLGLCEAIDRPDLAQDARFETNASRTENAQALYALLGDLLAQRPASVWVQLLLAAGIPAAPVNTVADLFEDPQIEARGMLPRVEQPGAGSIPVCGMPLRLVGQPEPTYGPAPRLGEHTREVLSGWLGTSDADLASLRREDVI
jgi:crotonobetainyl-CoA:carnitine CoA-transferase CaiB-like acyl-CoA transferase